MSSMRPRLGEVVNFKVTATAEYDSGVALRIAGMEGCRDTLYRTAEASFADTREGRKKGKRSRARWKNKRERNLRIIG